jgi:cell division protein FtsX
MNRSFFFILILITLVLVGWSYVHYQYLESREFRLNQLSELPIFVYMDDMNQLQQLARELLETIPEIDSLFLESGLQAAQEMLSDFPELGIEPNTLTEYQFPNILSITLNRNFLLLLQGKWY